MTNSGWPPRCYNSGFEVNSTSRACWMSVSFIVSCDFNITLDKEFSGVRQETVVGHLCMQCPVIANSFGVQTVGIFIIWPKR